MPQAHAHGRGGPGDAFVGGLVGGIVGGVVGGAMMDAYGPPPRRRRSITVPRRRWSITGRPAPPPVMAYGPYGGGPVRPYY
ncbi:hypothetical protein RAA17_20885 [Komagataeibacter rhaeticus]|nr:hypothetical protein [Komagataeibacter rhaeticus]